MDNDTNVLPENFDGVFRFTNFTDEDFTAMWNKVEYTFPANKTSPLVIPGETPEGVQSIRKKFAKELAEREFYRSEKGQFMNSKAAGPRPALYTDSDLAPFVQRCLEPLPIAPAAAKAVKDDVDAVFKTDAKGQRRTKVLEEGDSLTAGGTAIG